MELGPKNVPNMVSDPDSIMALQLDRPGYFSHTQASYLLVSYQSIYASESLNVNFLGYRGSELKPSGVPFNRSFDGVSVRVTSNMPRSDSGNYVGLYLDGHGQLLVPGCGKAGPGV